MTHYSKQIAGFYDQNAQHEWERMQRHPTEFGVTLRVLAERLPPPPAHILDVGGGPGRYAIELARQGYTVTLFDLTPANLRLAQEKAQEVGVHLAAYEEGTALDLGRFADSSFDAVLLMGPLYHLLERAERSQAVAEAQRVLRPGGPLLAAFITRYAGHRDSARRDPEWLARQPEQAQHILDSGRWEPSHDPDEPAWVAYMAHPAEVDDLFWENRLEVQGKWGLEGLVSGIEAGLNDLDPALFQRWLELNYQLSSDPCLFGGVEHLLVGAVKPMWRAVVADLAQRLDTAGLAYTIVGGASLALNGARLPVKDVDIEMDAAGVYRFQEIFPEQVVQPVGLSASQQYRSHFGRFNFDGVTVEVMGDLQRREGDAWLPTHTSTRQVVWLPGGAGTSVPVQVAWLEEETLSNLRRGRLERAAACLPLCDPARLTALLRGQVKTCVI